MMEICSIKRLMAALLAVAVVFVVFLAFFREACWLCPGQGRVVFLDSGTVYKLGTFVQIKLRCNDEEVGCRAINSALAAIDSVDCLLSTYRSDSEISGVNKYAADSPVAIDEETYQLLSHSLAYSRMSGGAFDITVAPLLRLWRQGGVDNKLPDSEHLASAKEKVGYGKVELRRDGLRYLVSFSQKGVELNVDAIAKGYAVDKAMEALRVDGVLAGLVNIGGEIGCFNSDELSNRWKVGIQDPFIDADEEKTLVQRPRWTIDLNNGAVATSGNYRRYFTVAGHKYSHIIDPRTGMPADAVPSVTVIAPLAADADALATALSVMVPEEGIALVETLADTEAFLVVGSADDFEIYCSGGFEKYSQGKAVHSP